MGADQLVGGLMVSVGALVFLYYTTWVLIMPFVDAEQPIQRFFLAREYAVLIPCVLLLVAVTAVFSFLALVMIKSASKQKKA